MQKTRLNNLVDQTVTRIDLFFINPWRRIALILISLLLGIFMGTAIPTTAGQRSYIDLVVAVCLVLFTETISIFIYSRKKQKRTTENNNLILIVVLNSFKIGLTFGLYLEAVKLST